MPSFTAGCFPGLALDAAPATPPIRNLCNSDGVVGGDADLGDPAALPGLAGCREISNEACTSSADVSGFEIGGAVAFAGVVDDVRLGSVVRLPSTCF